MNETFIDIYNNKSRFKLGVVILALLLGAASLYYTDILLSRLAEREKKLIQLYAQAVEAAVNPEVDDDLTFLMQGIITANTSVPVILTKGDSILSYRNIDIPDNASPERIDRLLKKELLLMKEQYNPIVINLGGGMKNFIYYRDSDLLYQLRYYPYVQLTVVTIFGFLTYLAFSYSRRAEQNRIWVGLAKETAHQLGTPISSLMAWVNYMRLGEEGDVSLEEMAMEMEKDVKRLEMVAARFSSIGSEPVIKEEDIYFVLLGITNYLQRRISDKIAINIKNQLPRQKMAFINRHLFEWVIENLCKNAVDAIGAKGVQTGKIDIVLKEEIDNKVAIDISDTGKGMTKQLINKVFHPGFTTKKRGWGLGLTLAKRIIENYHKGKIFIKHSEVDKGTTFRILLNT
ncbi:MAG: sensor histidine kinase [Cytophagales bacterium]|nr:MAG: sensor histidine kinase [Cytophagales bacterium]